MIDLRGMMTLGLMIPTHNVVVDNASDSVSNVGNDSDGLSETQVVNFMKDIRDAGDEDISDFADTVHIDIWKKRKTK